MSVLLPVRPGDVLYVPSRGLVIVISTEARIWDMRDIASFQWCTALSADEYVAHMPVYADSNTQIIARIE